MTGRRLMTDRPMIEVDVENFQSIVKTSLQIDGYTVLLGRSNIGKSALVRAIQCALTGALGTDFVRHGAKCERRAKKAKKCRCQTTVTIKSDGLKVVWEKGDDINQYRITRSGGIEQVYNALDRGEPEFLKPEFQQVQIGDSKELLQISEQFKPIFLLNKTGGVIADVLSDVAKLDDINEAMRLVNKDRKDASSTRTVRENDARDLRKELASFADVPGLVTRSETLEARITRARSLDASVKELQRFLASLSGLKVSMESLALATKPALPDWGRLSKRAAAFLLLVRFSSDHQSKAAVVEHLSPVDLVVVPELSGLWSKVKVLKSLSGMASKQAEVTRLAKVGETQLSSLDAVSKKLEEAKRVSDWVRRVLQVKSLMAKHQTLEEVPHVDLGRVRRVAETFRQIHAFERRYGKLVQDVEALTEKAGMADQAVREILQEYADLGVCPTCTQSISPDHFHVGG